MNRVEGRNDVAGAALAPRVWFAASAFGLLLVLVIFASLLPHFRNSAELVRMRNALLFDSTPAVYAWTPGSVPEGFALDDSPASASYARVVQRHGLAVPGDDWATALAIGHHLLGAGRLKSSPIQSDLDQTYERITQKGEGYCGDYADTFTGLAYAAGLFTRPWAFSFDGFSGRGHIYNEVWDRGTGRWIAIDVFNNIYFGDAAGRPMSAVELRQALTQRERIIVTRIRPDVRMGFMSDEQAIGYYRRGLHGWYMWWGTNVFEYDQSVLVRTFSRLGRSAEQLGGIAAGVHPRIRVLHEAGNEADRRALDGLQLRLMALVALVPVCLGLLAMGLRARARGRRLGQVHVR